MSEERKKGIYLNRTETNHVRIEAHKHGDSIGFTLDPDTAQSLISQLQSEVHKARDGVE